MRRYETVWQASLSVHPQESDLIFSFKNIANGFQFSIYPGIQQEQFTYTQVISSARVLAVLAVSALLGQSRSTTNRIADCFKFPYTGECHPF